MLVGPLLRRRSGGPCVLRRWLMRRLLELVVYLGLLMFLIDQYVEPAIANSMR